jgi:chemotaxis protein methyltransferase WspC
MTGLQPIADLLREQIGLDADSLGPTGLTRAVSQCMQRLACEDAEDYLERLHDDRDELDRLITAVTVPETWFFRGPAAFECLQKRARKAWLAGDRSEPFRALSLACCTGEEPYSIAMALLDVGLDAEKMSVEGVDVNPLAIRAARDGCYRERAFREDHPLARRCQRRYVSQGPGGWEVQPAVRRCVSFTQGNLLEVALAGHQPPYDAIFCRNVFIYMDAASCRNVQARIDTMLAEDGLLFLGPGENGPVDYCSAGFPRSFAFRRAEAEEIRRTSQPVQSRPHPRRQPTAKNPISVSPAPPVPAAHPSRPDPQTLLRQARRQADTGQLVQARETCQSLLAISPDQPEVYALLGTIALAEDDPERAEDAFGKAAYLDPHHAESLANLALLAERRGDGQSAELLRGRLERADRKEGN